MGVEKGRKLKEHFPIFKEIRSESLNDNLGYFAKIDVKIQVDLGFFNQLMLITGILIYVEILDELKNLIEIFATFN